MCIEVICAPNYVSKTTLVSTSSYLFVVLGVVFIGGSQASSVSDYAAPRPMCLQVECDGDGAYAVRISDLRGGTVSLGSCAAEGQTLTKAGYEGSVMCAAPEELCGVLPRLHVAGGLARSAKQDNKTIITTNNN